MIRYVLAVLLTVAIVGMAMPVVNDAAVDGSEGQVRAEIAAIEDAAVSLAENEVVPPEGVERESARRVVEVRFPGKSLTSRAVRFVRIEPNYEAGFSTVTYAVGDRPTKTTRIDALLVDSENESLRLGGSERRTLELRLERDEADNRVVVVRRG